ncbi:MAG: hypothetical protein WA190_08740 [Usitatibacter sp.]
MKTKLDTLSFAAVTSVMAAMTFTGLVTLFQGQAPPEEARGFQVALDDDANPADEPDRAHRVPGRIQRVDALDLQGQPHP